MIKSIFDDFLVIMPLCGLNETYTMNKDLKRYIKDCIVLFPLYGLKEKRFMERIICNIAHQNITYDEIIEQFGSPYEIVTSYFNEQEDMYLIKRTRTYKSLLISIIVILFILLLISCIKTR